MNLRDTIRLRGSGDFMGPGAAHIARVSSDASPSDLASHHVWADPSSTDTSIQNWRAQRRLEKLKRRTMDPFEAGVDLGTLETGG